MSRVFKALYPGLCYECERGFGEGDPVRFDDDNDIVHDECPPPARQAAVCPRCFIAHAGECF